MDCVAKTNDRSLHQFFYWSYLGLSFYACLPLFNQVSIVLIRNTLFRKCLSQNLFLVPVIGYWDVDLIILSIFSIKVQFSVPLFCPQTKPFCMQIKGSSKKNMSQKVEAFHTFVEPPSLSHTHTVSSDMTLWKCGSALLASDFPLSPWVLHSK